MTKTINLNIFRQVIIFLFFTLHFILVDALSLCYIQFSDVNLNFVFIVSRQILSNSNNQLKCFKLIL